MALDNLIDGRAIAEQIHVETGARVELLKKRGIQPGLAFVRVGEDPASKVYVGMKEKTSARLGIASQTHVFPQNSTQVELLAFIRQLNRRRIGPWHLGAGAAAQTDRCQRDFRRSFAIEGRGWISPLERGEAPVGGYGRLCPLHPGGST